MSGVFEAFVAAKRAHNQAVLRLIPSGHRCGQIDCSADEWEATEIASLKEKVARSALMPTEQDAINLMHDCYRRLEELGWQQAIYCPKDGSEFDALEAGSTGIHRCYYDGEWPQGHWWIAEDGDLWPSRPILYRPTEKEVAEREERIARFQELCRDSDGTAIAAQCEDIAVPEGLPSAGPQDIAQ